MGEYSINEGKYSIKRAKYSIKLSNYAINQFKLTTIHILPFATLENTQELKLKPYQMRILPNHLTQRSLYV